MKGLRFRKTDKYTIGDDPKVIEDTCEFEVIEMRISKTVSCDSVKWGDNTLPGTLYEYEYLVLMDMDDGSKGLCVLEAEEVELYSTLIVNEYKQERGR